MMNLENMTVEDLASLITKGVGSSIEEILYQDFKNQAEAAARRAAKELAERISGQVHAIRKHDVFELVMDVDLKMISPEAAPAGRVVGVKDGVPIVAWNTCDLDLTGKKIFVA